MIVVGETSDDVRTWAEQLQGVDVPRVALVTAAIEPIAASYVGPDGYRGYLAGYRDTLGYNADRNAETRTPYAPPDDLGFDLPDLDAAQWNSTALGVAVAAADCAQRGVQLVACARSEATVTPADLDLIAGWVSLVLTVLVFSYLLGDNVLYRLAVHLLVGVAAGYLAIVAVEHVLIPWFDNTLFAVQGTQTDAEIRAVRVFGALPLLFGALLLFKFSPRLAPVGNLGLAILIGVGTAVAIVGAVGGTLIPLARETGDGVSADAVEGVVMLVGVITTLLAFQYLGARRAGTGSARGPSACWARSASCSSP